MTARLRVPQAAISYQWKGWWVPSPQCLLRSKIQPQNLARYDEAEDSWLANYIHSCDLYQSQTPRAPHMSTRADLIPVIDRIGAFALWILAYAILEWMVISWTYASPKCWMVLKWIFITRTFPVWSTIPSNGRETLQSRDLVEPYHAGGNLVIRALFCFLFLKSAWWFLRGDEKYNRLKWTSDS
jgi:hypothetical protein